MSEFEEFARSHGCGGDFQRGCNGQYKSDLLHFMEKAFMHQQTEIYRLNNVLAERTKEWLEAIECGTYFENVAKPLKAENDNLKTQLTNMEQCYIGIKQEHNELIAFNTGIDRKQKVAEKTAEKYKFKVSMIADLLRDCVDQDMTLKAIKTVIDRVGES